MVLDIDVSVLIGVAGSVVGAWLGIAKLFVVQFERRLNDRFADLQQSIAGQESKLDGHLTKQDTSNVNMVGEIRKVENQLAQCRIDAANTYQTKSDAGHQFGQIIQEIRGLGARIDAMHGRVVGGN